MVFPCTKMTANAIFAVSVYRVIDTTMSDDFLRMPFYLRRACDACDPFKFGFCRQKPLDIIKCHSNTPSSRRHVNILENGKHDSHCDT